MCSAKKEPYFVSNKHFKRGLVDVQSRRFEPFRLERLPDEKKRHSGRLEALSPTRICQTSTLQEYIPRIVLTDLEQSLLEKTSTSLPNPRRTEVLCFGLTLRGMLVGGRPSSIARRRRRPVFPLRPRPPSVASFHSPLQTPVQTPVDRARAPPCRRPPARNSH